MWLHVQLQSCQRTCRVCRGMPVPVTLSLVVPVAIAMHRQYSCNPLHTPKARTKPENTAGGMECHVCTAGPQTLCCAITCWVNSGAGPLSPVRLPMPTCFKQTCPRLEITGSKMPSQALRSPAAAQHTD